MQNIQSKTSIENLTLKFCSKYVGSNSFNVRDSTVDRFFSKHELKDVCNYIKNKVREDIIGNHHGIRKCLIQAGDEEFDIIDILTCKEVNEDKYYKTMEALDKNSHLTVVAEYIPVSECNKAEITNMVEMKFNSDHDIALSSCYIKFKVKNAQKTQNCSELNEEEMSNSDEKKDSENIEASERRLKGTRIVSSTYNKLRNKIAIKESDRYCNYTESSKMNFVGLVNQAMTCYLNSLLQALYMTPEFRNALYNWEYNGSEKDAHKNIPFQLQKLFLNLQTSEKSVETTALTHSFGWEATDAWNQHDIQELCRVMFDALEKTFKNTKQADFINRLYEGKILDYVKCLTCNLEKSREDSFLDIPLPLRSFDGRVTYGSVEEALEAFVKYETLEGNNQYSCEKCNKKSNAHKGLKFSKFPYILTLQLKRFDFDYNTFHRMKLNDKVTFPDKLNLNSLISSNQEITSQDAEEEEQEEAEEETKNIKEEEQKENATSVESEENSTDGVPITNNSNHLTNSNHDQDDDEGIEMCNGVSPSTNSDGDKMREYYAKAVGPYIYELFCIMIHSGSASGGHYYAYIKDFRTNKWWCFDDQRVSPITEKDIQNTYGGGSKTSYYSGAFRSSTNAYMLMYRQIDSERNVLPMKAEDFPPHLKNLLERIRKCEEDNSYLEQECHEQHTKLEVFFRQPKNPELYRVIFSVSMSYTVGQIAKIAFNSAGLDGSPDPERLRIVVYNTKYNLVERVLDSDKRLDNYYESPTKLKDLMLEVRQPNEEFESYPSNPIITKVYLVNPDSNELIDGPKYVRAQAQQSVREYKQELKKHFNVDPKVLQLFSPEMIPNELMKDDDKFEENLSDNYPYRVFATEFYNAFKEKTFLTSNFYDISSRLQNTVTFYIDTYEVTPKNLEKNRIPSLENYYREEKTQESASNHNCLTEEVAKIHVTPDKVKSTSTDALDSVGNQFTHAYDKGNSWNLNYAEANNSEDSSLSDSDKTIVNEEMTDNADMIDDEAQSYMSVKGLVVQQQQQQQPPYSNKITNGEHPVSDFILKIQFLKVEKLWFVTMDKEITEEQLKEKLEPLIKVPKNYFKVGSYLSELPYNSSSNNFRDDRKYMINLGRVLQPDENFIEIYTLRMNDAQPLVKLLDTGLNKNVSVSAAKRLIFSELRKVGCIDLPYERLRFVEIDRDDLVGEELEDDDKCFKSINKICVQELQPSDNYESSNWVQVHVRRWNRSKTQLDDPLEISVSKNTFSADLRKQVSAMSSISAECLEFSVQVARKAFILEKIESFEWKTEVLPTEVDFKTYVMYRDSKESPKEDTEKIDWYFRRERYSTPLTGVSFSRREKALKIHVDT